MIKRNTVLSVLAAMIVTLGLIVAMMYPTNVANATGTNKITFCHATHSETNPYNLITTSVAAFYNAGHLDHQNDEDIFPAGSFKGQSWTAQGDQSILAAGCVVGDEPVVTQEQDETYGPGDCATLTQVMTVVTYNVIDGVRQDPPVSTEILTIPWIPLGDECETEEPTPTPTPTETPTVPTETPTVNVPTETPTVIPETPTETPDPDKPEPETPVSTPQPPKDVQVIACVNGVWVTTVNGEVISKSGTCEETPENSEPQTFSETGL